MKSSPSRFGDVDLELAREPGAAEAAPAREPAFGELDLDAVGVPPEDGTPTPVLPRAAPSYPFLRPTPQSLEAVRLAEEESRIARARGVPEETPTRPVVLDVEDVTRMMRVGPSPAGEEPGGLEPLELDDEHTILAGASPDGARLALMTSRRVPRLLVGPSEIAKLPMDPRAAFILGHVDGVHSMEEILDVCAMPEGEALELIDRLRALGVIALG